MNSYLKSGNDAHVLALALLHTRLGGMANMAMLQSSQADIYLILSQPSVALCTPYA